MCVWCIYIYIYIYIGYVRQKDLWGFERKEKRQVHSVKNLILLSEKKKTFTILFNWSYRLDAFSYEPCTYEASVWNLIVLV